MWGVTVVTKIKRHVIVREHEIAPGPRCLVDNDIYSTTGHHAAASSTSLYTNSPQVKFSTVDIMHFHPIGNC